MPSFKIEEWSPSLKNKNIRSHLKRELSTFMTYEDKNPDYIFILGGDGTFLRTAQKYFDKEVKLIGINTGTLGFYTAENEDILDYDLKDLKKMLSKKNFFNPLILEMQFFNNSNQRFASYNILNDIVVQSPYTIRADFCINGKGRFLQYAGSGFILCTPTGSSGINKSNNGPVFFSSLRAYCLSFIMPLNNSKYASFSNPFLFREQEVFSAELKDNTSLLITYDGILLSADNLQELKTIRVIAKKAKCSILVSYETYESLQRLQRFF